MMSRSEQYRFKASEKHMILMELLKESLDNVPATH